MDKLELLGLFPQELGDALADMKLPAYRVSSCFPGCIAARGLKR